MVLGIVKTLHEYWYWVLLKPLQKLVLVLGIVNASSKIGIGVKKRGIAQVCPTGTYMTASAIVNSLSRTDSMAEADVELLQSDRFYGLSRGRIPSVGQFLWPRQRSTTFFSQG